MATMESRPPNSFTTAEMRLALREKGLTTGGAKAELIQRINGNDPSIWTELEERRWRAAGSSGVTAGMHPPGEEGDDVEETEAGGDSLGERNRAMSESGERNPLEEELSLLRRECEIMVRERQLLQRELELMRGSPVLTTNGSVISAFGGVRGIKELLPEFDATDGTFWKWKQQLELLTRTYQLDENSVRVLISSRLRGRALSWFYSKPEYITIRSEDLLREMESMFDLRPGRLSLRREFESRIWRTDESFCDYYHEKVIFANRVPIAGDELLDYII